MLSIYIKQKARRRGIHDFGFFAYHRKRLQRGEVFNGYEIDLLSRRYSAFTFHKLLIGTGWTKVKQK